MAKTFEQNLWSDNPRKRLDAARSISLPEKKRLLDTFRKSSPARPRWPFGMPTSVNPYVVILGVSPGAKTDDNGCPPYDLPTIGLPHDGFGGEYSKPGQTWEHPNMYWDKVRDLCVRTLQAIKPTISRRDCISLSGHLNLGLTQTGIASEDALDSIIVDWIPKVVVNDLKPRLLICFGLKAILKTEMVQGAFLKSNTLSKMLTDDPTAEVKFKFKPRYRFRIWDVIRPDGGKMSIVMWPNHPSRHPFAGGADGKAWIHATNQFAKMLSNRM